MKKTIDKIKNLWNKKLKIGELCLFTFIIALTIICIIYVLNEVTPFGNKSLLQVDFFHQYGPMLGELYDRVHNFSSLIYSFNMGLGLPLFRNFLNYMSSPFNIIMLFFKRNDLLTSYSVIIGLKAVVSSVSMVYYLGKKYKTTELYLIPFGLIYAFSAYFSAYYWNLMWIDGMVYLPLITLGIERIIDDGKWKTYTIWLAIMMLANYYIGYMICIFACLYFIVYSFNKFVFKKGEFVKSLKTFVRDGVKFADASLLAAGIIAVVLIPLYFSISSISATGGEIPTSQYYLFTVSDFLKYHFSGVMPTVFASGDITAPNVSCGILAFFLLIAFIVNVEVPVKEKIGYIILLGFFIVAFFFAPLDYILQGFHVPNDLPYRYSFIYSFILILISVYSFRNIKTLNYRMTMLIYIILSVVLMVLASEEYIGISENMIYTNMIILGIYFVFYSIAYANKVDLKIVYVVMIVLSIGDVLLSVNEHFDVSQIVDSFYADYDNVRNKLDYINDNDSELFYRIERENRLTLNDTSWYNYYGMTSFSSMNYENMAILEHNLGMAGNVINSYIYNQSTPIYDTMFDIKYFIGNSRDNKRYTLLLNSFDDIYKYDYNVGLGYGVNKNIDNWNREYTDPFKMQNEYMELATGVDNVLVPISYTNSETVYKNGNQGVVKYIYNNPGDNLYFYSDNYNVDFIILNGCLYYNNSNYLYYDDTISELYYQLEDYGEKHIINFISDQNQVVIYVGYSYDDNRDIKLYTINHYNFDKAIQKLRSNKLNITKFKETRIEGNINLSDDMVVYTSIPYDSGWHVLVDGESVKTRALSKSLLAFDASSGEHDVVIYYRVKGLTIGIIVSILSISLLVIDTFFHDKIKEKLRSKV